MSEFRRVAIVNRGEAAMRFINAVREFNHENATEIRTVALFTEPDRRAMFVREADEAIDLGPALFTDPKSGRRRLAYLDHDHLAWAFSAAKADAVWTGWGFVAEQADFAALVERLGLVHIGPDAASMSRLSDKVAAKRLAESVDVPVVPWSGGVVESVEAARSAAERLGCPVLLKASAGGGGRGIRRVNSLDELPQAFERARAESIASFGEGALLVERALDGVRHLEVQVVADGHGGIWTVGIRDCTVQRRFQKVLEECPAQGLTRAEESSLAQMAEKITRAGQYRSTGTVEFLFEPKSRRFSFVEFNTRMQVEHPVTEVVTGLDLVKLQLKVARGGHLVGAPPAISGHAIEVRLSAEDPDEGFAPRGGRLAFLRVPTGPGLRIDRGYTEGDVLPAEFDPLVAKFVARGADRPEALSRLRRALMETAVVIEGGATNRPFLLDLVNRPEIRNGSVDTAWLEAYAGAADRPGADVAFAVAAAELDETERHRERVTFFESAARQRPEVRAEAGRTVELKHRGQVYRGRIYRQGRKEWRIDIDDRCLRARIEALGPWEKWVTVGGRRYRVVTSVQGSEHIVEIDGSSHRFSRDDLGIVRAQGPAVVVAIPVEAGDEVRAGQPLAVVEAMKMETSVLAPFAGRVREVLVMPNTQVGGGTPLVRLDPPTEGTPTEGTRITFGSDISPEPTLPKERVLRALDGIRKLVLGFDVEPAEVKVLVSEYQSATREWAEDEEARRLEDDILVTFADISSLFRRQVPREADEDYEQPSSGEYFLTYLRTLGAAAPPLPAQFLDRLARALAHYGVPGLDQSEAHKDALLWIWKARQRSAAQEEALLAVLDRRLTDAGAVAGSEARDFADVLDRVIDASQHRHPSLCDVAREVRYRLFDQPAYEAVRRAVYEEAETHLAALRGGAEGDGRRAHTQALVQCPQHLQALLSGRFEAETALMRERMLEVLVRRYYRIREIGPVVTFVRQDRAFATTSYPHDGRVICQVSTHGREEDFARVVADLSVVGSEQPESEDVVADLYLWRSGEPEAASAVAARLAAVLATNPPKRPLRRLGVSIGCPGSGSACVQHFTFRITADGGYQEDTVFRGFHSMIGKRIRLWRLSNFELERLESAEDVYVFHAKARKNPKDERLFALAEIRDLTPERDDTGRVRGIPHLERMFMEALAGIRRFQSRRRPDQRLHWNRVTLEVWPSAQFDQEEILRIARKLAPATEGLGLESVSIRADFADPRTGEVKAQTMVLSNPGRSGLSLKVVPPTAEPMRPLSEYEQKVTRMRQRGLNYPYEIIGSMTPSGPGSDSPLGSFQEMDLDGDGHLVAVERAFGQNKANFVVGLVTNVTPLYPEGMTRVAVFGDPSREMGSIAEPECRRILEAIDLAERMNVPLEWFALSAGAKISMESGTENMDWISKVLRRIIEFTQKGGEINVLVCGINVGAQPYWNAEATMLMHTRGILVMIPEGAMVLTGKTALDYSGSVSAEDNLGIGGYERVMGPNGQAQYWARDLPDALRILFHHYAVSYVVPGERFPRRSTTSDPRDRDVRLSPHSPEGAEGFRLIGDVFSDETNPGRKKPFDIRRVLAAVADQDFPTLERWAGFRDAESAVVWDARIGGIPVCLLGFESRSLPRLGIVPNDGPEQWTSGTLFPRASKKIARAVNAASGNRPLVVLANLSGFDGSPESMRGWQLEFGAEIGRSVVNFQGPIVFAVVSRYHGGAFVVFSKTLHDNMEVVALEGTFASVIGGAPAAAVVFSREVDQRTKKDPRIVEIETAMTSAPDGEKRKLKARFADLYGKVRSEKLGEVADDFDRIHSVERARDVGSLDRILPARELRPYVIDALERRMAIELERIAARSATQ